MLTATTMPLIFETRRTPIGQRWLGNQHVQASSLPQQGWRFLVRVLWTDPTTIAPSGHGADGRGGIMSWGGGAMMTMKGKNNNDDEANAMTTITTTPETTMTICIVDNGNYQIVDCRLYCQF
jgi:hypothetical protein